MSPDRLIWLPLFAALILALVADQARANLHRQARATAMAAFDDALTAEAWCRLQLDALSGDRAPRIDPVGGFDPQAAFGGTLRASSRQLDGLPDRSADASL